MVLSEWVICFCFLWLPVTFRGARTSEPRNLGTSELSQQSSDSFVLDDATTRTSARRGARCGCYVDVKSQDHCDGTCPLIRARTVRTVRHTMPTSVRHRDAASSQIVPLHPAHTQITFLAGDLCHGAVSHRVRVLRGALFHGGDASRCRDEIRGGEVHGFGFAVISWTPPTHCRRR